MAENKDFAKMPGSVKETGKKHVVLKLQSLSIWMDKMGWKWLPKRKTVITLRYRENT